MIPFYKRSINIDASNKCTLECAACVRQIYRKNNWTIPGEDLTLSQFDKLTNYFKKVSFCGTFSDPIFNLNFADILKLCKEKNIETQISTSASHRPIKWYKEIFKSYSKAKWIFGIDGLPNESHKYRIHQNGEYLFDIMLMAHYQNIPVQWQYIVFDYNKNSIEKAKKIAKFHKIPFVLIYSNRNIDMNKDIKNTYNKAEIKNIINKNKKNVSYKASDLNENLETKINPKCLLSDRDLSFSNTGHIMPCCWLNTRYKENGISKLFDNKHHIDNNTTVEDIINSKDWNDFFETLKNNPSKAPLTCKRFCSNNVNDNPEETKIRYENNLL